MEDVEKDQCMGSIFGNQFRFLLMVQVHMNIISRAILEKSVCEMSMVETGLQTMRQRHKIDNFWYLPFFAVAEALMDA